MNNNSNNISLLTLYMEFMYFLMMRQCTYIQIEYPTISAKRNGREGEG